MTDFPRAPVVVLTSGVWSLFHRGHVNVLWRAKQLGDVLIVGVVTDEGTEAYKGSRPVDCYEERARAVRSLPFVDYVVRQEGTDPSELLERFRPDVCCHGSDWDRLLAGQETVERLGIRWVLLPYTPEVTSTMLRERAVEGRLEGGLPERSLFGILGDGRFEETLKEKHPEVYAQYLKAASHGPPGRSP